MKATIALVAVALSLSFGAAPALAQKAKSDGGDIPAQFILPDDANDYIKRVEMGGYQLAISLDIFRGRYRDSFAKPSAIPANQSQRYKFRLPAVNHVFQPGHRIMVQFQSSLFPLYDRNPQTFVPNIFFAQPRITKRRR